MGVFPYLPTSKLELFYAPVAARFSEILGIKVNLRSRPDFERFRERVGQQNYDLIFIQPFDYVRTAADSGYLPLARWVTSENSQDTGELRAIFVVGPDSSAQTLSDLSGKRVATPDRDAAVSLLGSYALSKFQLDDDVEIRPLNNHLTCLKQVQLKKAAACVTAWPPLKFFRKQTGINFRVLYETSHIPSSLYAVHKSMPAEQQERLRAEMLSWNADNPEDRIYLHKGGWSRMYPASDSDYDSVREIWSILNPQNQ